MPYQKPTLDEVHDQALALRGNLMPDADTTENGFFWVDDRVLAGAVASNSAHLDAVGRDSTPLEASAGRLDEFGEMLALPRKGATPAKKSDALQVTGTSGSTVSVGDQLTHSTGLVFQVNEAATMPFEGVMNVDVLAVSTGAQTRLASGQELEFSSPPAGIEAKAKLVLTLDEGGEDAEQNGPYRERLLNHWRQPPAGGNANDYVQWALQVNDIGAAFVYARRAGLATVDVAVLHSGSGSARVPNDTKRSEVLTYIEARRPVTDSVRVLGVTAEPLDIEVTIEAVASGEYGWDWDDTSGPTVGSYNATTRELTFSANYPTSLTAGDLLVIKTTGATGAPYKVEALIDADTVRLANDPNNPIVTPAASDPIYAQSALSVAVRDAIKAHLDNLGTANPVSAGYDTTHIGSVDPSRLQALAYTTTGVRTAAVVTPTVETNATDPAFPADTTIGLITPGRLLVRRS